MITADQLVCHAIGDYVLQSDWMANEKTKKTFAAAAHAFFYSLPFLALSPTLAAFAVIPAWLSAWLLIIADNTLHVICNGVALNFL